MTESAHPVHASPVARGLAWCGGNRHFLVAAVLLAAAAGGWGLLVRAMGWATEKYAVPWPGGVQVNEQFRMTSLPERIGPYELVRQHASEDGEVEVGKEAMAILQIGTFSDERNRPQRESNWMTIRRYQDMRLAERHPMRYWRLEVYYYTGGVDLVPHVPEICGVASGAVHLRTEDMPVGVPPAAPAPWGGREVAFNRALFERSDIRGLSTMQFVQYYVFSLNGQPEADRSVVRLKLASPFVRHAYFAKIQFGPEPMYAPPDPAEADGPAREFARHFLPEVLKALPMPQDVTRLDERK